jgi:hypothetical protein
MPAHYDLAGGINAMYLEHRLSDVDTNCRDRLHDLAPPNRGSSAGTHFHGTHVPVEEPSTASIADIAGRQLAVRFVPKADITHRSERSLLFDHLVGAGEHREREPNTAKPAEVTPTLRYRRE